MNPSPHRIALIIPALNEAESIGRQLAEIPEGLVQQTIVADNGSRDGTAEIAAAAGADVVHEPRKGYGSACLRGIAHIRSDITALLFLDADLSHAPQDIEALVREFNAGDWDMVLGSRVLGPAAPGSLTPVQRFGNRLTARLIQWVWAVRFTDLGPLRIISRAALERLHMSDPDFGWTVEMQVKVARCGMKFKEVPVAYRVRKFGKSKVSGTLEGSARAGLKIFWTVYRVWREGTTPC